MPRPRTQLTATRAWLRLHRDHLGPEHGPMVTQLELLARSMDADVADKGRIQATHANAYRQILTELTAELPGATKDASRDVKSESGLFGPSAGEVVGL